MTPEAIQELLKRQPFEPFEVHLSNGTVHEVRHPEFAMLSPSRLVILDPVADRLAIVSLFQVAELRVPEPSGRAQD